MYNITESRRYIIFCDLCRMSTEWYSSKIAAESEAYKVGFITRYREDGTVKNVCGWCAQED